MIRCTDSYIKTNYCLSFRGHILLFYVLRKAQVSGCLDGDVHSDLAMLHGISIFRLVALCTHTRNFGTGSQHCSPLPFRW